MKYFNEPHLLSTPLPKPPQFSLHKLVFIFGCYKYIHTYVVKSFLLEFNMQHG